MVVDAIFYSEEDGACPVLEAFDQIPLRAKARGLERLERLKRLGATARRPLVENLGQGLWELRWHDVRAQYRMLYFFYGRTAVVLVALTQKERQIPQTVINRALVRKSLFEASPKAHTYQEKE